MAKIHINAGIDLELYQKAKDKNAPFSKILSDALQKWLIDNESSKEKEARMQIVAQAKEDEKYITEANDITFALLKSSYASNLRKANLVKKGFSMEEIEKIFNIAKGRFADIL